jgi:hypothetical protein
MRKRFLTRSIVILFVSAILSSAVAQYDATAREKLSEVENAVAQLVSGAELIFVTTVEDVSLDGKVHQWMYFFKSRSQRMLYEIWYLDGTVTRHEPISSFEEFQVRLNFKTLPPPWIDSDAAVAVAEANGGSEFRQANGNQYAIAMQLLPPMQIAPFALWALGYRSQDTYLNILVNAVTGEFYELPRPTAREYFEQVNSRAVALADDAQLIYVNTNELDLTGESDHWTYLYQSPGQQTLYEFSVVNEMIIQSPEITNENPGVFLGIQPLPSDWIDSDLAISLAEADGGELYRQTYNVYQIVAELAHADGWESAKWAIDYQHPESAQIFSIDAVLPSEAGEMDAETNPDEWILYSNYPNPFNPSTTIRYTILKSSEVTLTIYNLLGKEITTLLNKTQTPGEYSVIWNGQSHASGIYICRLQAGDFTETRKLVLQK